MKVLDINEHKRLFMSNRPMDGKSHGKVLIVVASPRISPLTNKLVGFYASELTHAMWIFEEAGFEIEIASPEGGKVEMDSHSLPDSKDSINKHDKITIGYLATPGFKESLEKTKKVADVKESDYVAIFVAGGQGAIFSFHKNEALEKLVGQFYDAGKPTAAVCHGTCIFLTAKNGKGDLIVRGKCWTGFTDEEEKAVEAMIGGKSQPIYIEEEAKKIAGTHFMEGKPFEQHAVRDSNVITGQQQNSTTFTAQLAIEAMNHSRVKLFAH